MANKVLVVDDEKLIVKGIKFNLEQDGMEVDVAYDGKEALELAGKKDYDIILLDVMLPELDGFEVCQQIRAESDVPIIMLTAKDDDMDKILGLEYGADDYVTKPFNILELKARIKAITRRTKNRKAEESTARTLVSGDLRIELESRRVFIEDKEINLTAKEFDLLELLITNPNKVYKRDNLLNLVWGFDYPGDVRTVDVHVRRLREKIEKNPSDPRYIHTKWGVGYYFQK
jgi:DNA-binding response OmpR family regulator